MRWLSRPVPCPGEKRPCAGRRRQRDAGRKLTDVNSVGGVGGTSADAPAAVAGAENFRKTLAFIGIAAAARTAGRISTNFNIGARRQSARRNENPQNVSIAAAGTSIGVQRRARDNACARAIIIHEVKERRAARSARAARLAKPSQGAAHITKRESCQAQIGTRGTAALAFDAAGMAENGDKPPVIRSLSDLRPAREYRADAEGAVVGALPLDLPEKTVRLNVSLDEHLVEHIDRTATVLGQTRPGFLAEAAKSKLRGAA